MLNLNDIQDRISEYTPEERKNMLEKHLVEHKVPRYEGDGTGAFVDLDEEPLPIKERAQTISQ